MIVSPSYPAYDVREHAPITAYRGDCRCALAAQDRDLYAEASDVDACVDAALEATCGLYPPLLFGLTALPTIVN